MKLLSYFTQLPDTHKLSPEDLINRQWNWSWTLSSFSGTLFMTILTAVLQIWPFLWAGCAILLMYAIYIPTLRRSTNFYLVSNIFCLSVMLWAFYLIIIMGGLLTSFGVFLVGLNVAMSSVLAKDMRWIIGLFGFYAFTIIAGGLAQPYLTTPDWVQPGHNLLYFVLNAFWLIMSAFSVTMLFVSDRSRHEKQEAERLKELDEVRTQFYTNITHEFRTPLTIINGIADQIKEDPQKWSKKGTSTIKNQGKRLLDLVNQMMDISKLESGSMTVNKVHGDIVAYLNYLVESFQGYAESKDISLDFKSSATQFFVDYDSKKLLHIISNLISNALKYTRQGGEVNISFDTKKTSSNPTFSIKVADNGIGIAPEAVPYIFDRYFQANNKLKARTSGSGLGLALTKGLVELMDGKISVSSKLDKGTTLTVEMPAESNSEFTSDHGISIIQPLLEDINSKTSEVKYELESNLTEQQYGHHPTILIVEDNASLSEYLATILQENYDLLIASNGKEGLDKAKQYIPDIIISDVMMPEMDGMELLEVLKKDVITNHIPVILLTALSDSSNKLTGLQKGADYYLSKPFEKQELLAVLKNISESRSRLQKKLAIYPLHQERKVKESVDHEVEFLEKIKSIVYKNCEDENFGVDQLLRLLGMSRAQLYRKFRALTGNSLARYIKKIRLHKAREFIMSDKLNVTEAALESGFRNLSHFSVIFKEEFGISPSEIKHKEGERKPGINSKVFETQ